MNLAGRQVLYAFGLADETAGIDQHTRSFTDSAKTVLPVPGDAGHISDQRIAGTRQRIEKGRFSNIGSTDDSYDR
jgi:hypothetical protein